MSLSFAEENYLKAIYLLSKNGTETVSTNAISEMLQTRPASVSDMIRKLSNKGVILYQKYQGVSISEEGKIMALRVIRKHRLWEVFLVEKLKFNWDEVHEVAEQLEHIRSPLLIRRLDEFLGFPKYDPHGEPIPDEAGIIQEKKSIMLSEVAEMIQGIVCAVNDSNPLFLKYLDRMGIYIGAGVRVVEKIDFDGSMVVLIDNKQKVSISREVCENLWLSI
ncbi:MAG: metal-dependent transcriptional regulator [Cyclobacteriaceae bacterium]|nr:metal-dependent transcriptional regulator [Cyclobacteriaceae bacterium]